MHPLPEEHGSGAGTFPRCRLCKLVHLPPKPDPCLGLLPNVLSADCGHGRDDRAHVAFDDGREALYGEAAVEWFRSQGVGPQGDLEERRRNTR